MKDFKFEKIISYFLLILMLLMINSSAKANGEIILQRCLPKADMENITIKCGMNEAIAIKEAFFTSSIVDQCPFVNNINEILNGNNEKKFKYHHQSKDNSSKEDEEEINSLNFLSCTDDLRLTLNSKCSGHSACSVNLRKLHLHQCSGYDGWINLKYTCVVKNKINSYCAIELKDTFGYVTNPGYPKFYPPYDCKWKISGYPGQRVQIQILDLSLREPRYNPNKKSLISNYECIDSVTIIENDVKLMSICGETKSNLIEFRSKTNELVIDFHSYDFSPTRGLFFKYTMIDCPTMKPPINGYMYRNQSFAYYHCYYDYVFEDTGETSKVLFCEYETYWNGSVTKCIPKENLTVTVTETVTMGNTAYALGHASIKPDSSYQPIIIEKIDQALMRPVTLIIIGIISLLVILTIIGMLIFLKRFHFPLTSVNISV